MMFLLGYPRRAIFDSTELTFVIRVYSLYSCFGSHANKWPSAKYDRPLLASSSQRVFEESRNGYNTRSRLQLIAMRVFLDYTGRENVSIFVMLFFFGFGCFYNFYFFFSFSPAVKPVEGQRICHSMSLTSTRPCSSDKVFTHLFPPTL